MTSPSPAPLTEAERAAASEVQNFCWHTGPSTDPTSLCGECDKVARAVVAAVRGPIEADALEEAAAMVESIPSIFVQRASVVDRLRKRAAARQSLSLPASKETQK